VSGFTSNEDLKTKLYIGGRFVDAVDGSTFKVEDPAQASALAEVGEAMSADVNRAVLAARRAHDQQILAGNELAARVYPEGEANKARWYSVVSIKRSRGHQINESVSCGQRVDPRRITRQ
jgi:hypothetical protein